MFAYDDRPPPFGVDGYDAKTEFNCVQPRYILTRGPMPNCQRVNIK